MTRDVVLTQCWELVQAAADLPSIAGGSQQMYTRRWLFLTLSVYLAMVKVHSLMTYSSGQRP